MQQAITLLKKELKCWEEQLRLEEERKAKPEYIETTKFLIQTTKNHINLLVRQLLRDVKHIKGVE